MLELSVEDFLVVFFFFKQKTAYEIPLCDWSSDVCSSDLYPSIGASRQGLEPTPEQAVMHEQQVGSLLRRQAHRRFAQIDSHRHPAHRPLVRDLQPVDGMGSVGHRGDPKVAIKVAIEVRDQ